MMKRLMYKVKGLFWVVFVLTGCISFMLNGQSTNGQLDKMTDFASKQEFSILMPDGVNLKADVYLPVFMDSLTLPFSFPGFEGVEISLIQQGNQYIIYDSINGEPNPNPYELPTLFIRTPYNKETEGAGHLMAFLGYSVVIQDNRGAYASEGNYLPMFSDSWPKAPYHPDFVHSLDQFTPQSPKNANTHADGVNSLHYILNDLKRFYNGDSMLVSNGSVGMIGASALGNVQYQLAAAEKIDHQKPGLKGLLPIVATNEHYKSTAVQNGVFRQALVTNWITQQYKDLLDDVSPNTQHSSKNFNHKNKQEVAQKAIEYWLTENNGGKPSGYYPNSPIRSELDASFAPVDAEGKGALNGDFSRYGNMEVPMYHLTGWWDIFINGQIETFNMIRKNLDPLEGNVSKQKLVIGPWAHQTITEIKTGDVTYPDNVNDFLVDLQQLDGDLNGFPIGGLLNSEVLAWFRYTLNRNEFKNVGNPKVLIKAATQWQNLTPRLQIKIPSHDYIIPYNEFLEFLGGRTGLEDFPYTLKQLGFEFDNTFDFTPLEEPILQLDETDQNSAPEDMSLLPPVRLYIAASEQNKAGNYWMQSDSFPFKNNIVEQKIYLGNEGALHLENSSITKELTYVHDPDKPVSTVGGANMTIKSPQLTDHSQGQINLADPLNAPFTMNRPDVLQFTSPPLGDTLSVIGFPEVSFYASSSPLDNPSDSTDTDFFLRILEVLPTGEEFFVVAGAVNARARLYAESIANGNEDPSLPFDNIASGKVYHYHFQCLPIGYTFQKGNRIKILVSSSNYPRYQSNPNIPLEKGEFILRKPYEDKTYTFKGRNFKARKAQQTLFLGADYPAQVILPVYNGQIAFENNVTNSSFAKENLIQVFPNPASKNIHVISDFQDASLEVYSLSGSKVFDKNVGGNALLNVQNWPEGVYFLKLTESKGNDVLLRKIIIQH